MTAVELEMGGWSTHTASMDVVDTTAAGATIMNTVARKCSTNFRRKCFRISV